MSLEDPGAMPTFENLVRLVAGVAGSVLRFGSMMAFASTASAVETLYDAGDPTADEQSVLEVINRARVNPAAEGARLCINIAEGLPASQRAGPRAPLAMNKILLGTARAHSRDMYERKYFAHEDPDGDDPFERMQHAGYSYLAAAENIAAGSAALAPDLEDLLMRDTDYPGRGHRVNLLSLDSVKTIEIGIGYYSGAAPITGSSSAGVNGLKNFLTQDFGTTSTGPFVLGVVYTDTNHNGFYDPGEGLSGVTVAPDQGDSYAITGAAGGYAFPVGTSGTLTVTASGGDLPAPLTQVVTLSVNNTKVDFVPGAPSLPSTNLAVVAEIGSAVPGQPSATVYRSLGTPQPGPSAGVIQMGKSKTTAIFAADGSVRLQVGDSVPGLPGTSLLKLGEPSGDAVRATLRLHGADVTVKNDELLLGGLTAGPVTLAAREGQPLIGLSNVTLKKILVFDGTGPTYFFSALLQGGDVTSKSDLALCAAAGDGSVRVVLREGQMIGAKKVTTLATLVALPGTVAEGRWRVDAQNFGVRVTYADQSQELFSIPATAVSASDFTSWLATGAAFHDTTLGKLGFPGFGPAGPACAVTLTHRVGSVAAADDVAMVRGTAQGLVELATEGGLVPDGGGATLPQTTFKSFGNPVCGANGRTAFSATIAGPGGKTGLWDAPDGLTLQLLARAGEAAPGGGQWAKFGQLVLPKGASSGPIFLATLAPSRVTAITGANNLGLWAVDSTGGLRLLLRTGQLITVNSESRTLAKLVALTTNADSTGAAQGYDETGLITVQATFTDRSVAILRIRVP